MNSSIEIFNCERFKTNMDRYKKLGYRWNISANGYQVWFKDEYLHGAGTANPNRKRHWRHCRADVIMYTSHVYDEIEKHRNKEKIKTISN